MSLAHLAISSRDVQATAQFLCQTMRWRPVAIPDNVPRDVAWIDVSEQQDGSQQIHVIHVEDFSVSPFECEFGRHLAVFHDGEDMGSLRQRICSHGGELIDPLRSTPFERFFFREPTNGYVFEVIHRQQWKNAS